MANDPGAALLVDDSPTVRRMLCCVFQAMDIRPLEAANGRAALEALGRESVGLAVVDLNMPVMDGLTLLRRLRAAEEWRDLPVVMLTTESREKDMRLFYEAGANMYLAKPATPQLIRYKALSLLGLRESDVPPPEAAESPAPILKDFLLESRELLNKLDRDFIALQKASAGISLLGSIVRCLHTIGGASNYLDFRCLKAVTAAGKEAAVSLRDRRLALTADIARTLADATQALWEVRSRIEKAGGEGDAEYAALIEKLNGLCRKGRKPALREGAAAAVAAAERLSLDLVVNGKIDRAGLNAAVDVLGRGMTDPEGRALLERLAALAGGEGAGGPNDKEAYGAAVKTLDAICRHLRGERRAVPGGAAEPGEAEKGEVLTFDVNVKRELLESFFSEASGHLETIEQQALHLESMPRDEEALATAFRSMHSLKGLAGFLNAGAVHRLAHEAETVMDLARKRKQGISPGECNVMLRSVDVLREMIGLVLQHTKKPGQAFPRVPSSYGPFLEELRHLAGEIPEGPGVAETPAAPAEDAARSPETEPEASFHSLEHTRLVRVKVEKLDSLLDTIGELVVTQTQVNQDPALKLIDSPRLSRNLAQLKKTTRDLQAVAMSLRMYPLRDTFARMTRVTRDLARKQGKEVDVITSGEDTEMDKNVIEALVDPLTHLVRNAVDHGVDSPQARVAAGKTPRGRITLSARYQGDDVVVEVSDDGNGLDRDRIVAKARQAGLVAEGEQPSDAFVHNLVFRAGFTTATSVSEVSGRGVGLDVVRRNVEALGGAVAVTSVPGRSCSFTLSLPLTLAIIDGLVVRVGQERYIVPITSVVESFCPQQEQISTIGSRGEMVEVRGTQLPLVRLADYAGIAGGVREPWKAIVMIVECRGERCGLMAEELLGQQQVVIKNLGDCLRDIKGVSGGAILGDGRVGLILDVSDVLEASRQASSAAPPLAVGH